MVIIRDARIARHPCRVTRQNEVVFKSATAGRLHRPNDVNNFFFARHPVYRDV